MTSQNTDELFRNAAEEALSFDDESLMRSFALQHLGKSLFDQSRYDEAVQCFYDAMMIRVRLKRNDLADSSRFALAQTVNRIAPPVEAQVSERILIDHRTPEFVRQVIGKCHSNSDLPHERSNCINAALNFYSGPPYQYSTRSTLEALHFLQSRFDQISSKSEPIFGDVLAYWSRSGGAWDHRTIDVAEMRTDDPDFPYGLVFEHIAVVVADKVLFHKPSPSMNVPYKLDHFEAVEAGLKHSRGFEVTLHRQKR